MDRFITQLEYFLAMGGTKKDIACLAISGAALIISIFDWIPLPFDAAWIAIILCGVPIILEAIVGLITSFDIKADVLVSLALIASIGIGEGFAAGEVAFIMQLGALLEDLTVAKARAGIEKLARLTPQTARILRDGTETMIPAEDVQIGDILRVLPGESVPADGVILSGQTSINQAVMTGESMPVDKAAGDAVASGTVNQFGVFEMEAAKAGTDSSIQRMIRLVQSADAGKAKIVSMADRWATWIVIIALTAAALTWLLTGEIIRAVTILVVFCPCALVLATPTAIMAAIGNAAKHGFLVRAGDALERLAAVRKIACDKTGTLTFGEPEVAAAKSLSKQYTDHAIYAVAAAAEQYSEHPLGKAIVRCYQKERSQDIMHALDFQMLPGRGVSAKIERRAVLAGNTALLAQHNIAVQPNLEIEAFLQQGSTITYIAIDGVLVGYIALSDTLRPDSAKVIDRLSKLGTPAVLLTGDHANAAKNIADQLHIQEVHADCLPEDKLNYIDRAQKENIPICMIGDGVNDAPALKKAAVGIAMGGIGSDIAIEAADIALVNDDIRALPHLIALSKRMMTTIKHNLAFSMGLNFLAIILAMLGTLNPVVGALVHNAGSVAVIINSALLLRWAKSSRIDDASATPSACPD